MRTAGVPSRITRRNAAEKFTAALYLAPALLLIAFFKIVPLGRGAWVSLTTSPALSEPKFAGLENYRRMVDDETWHTALINAGKGILVLPVFILLPLLLAFMLSQGVPGWRIFRGIYFISYLLPPVMVGYMFGTILGIQGPLNSLFRALGADFIAKPWLGQIETSMWAVYVVVLWSWFGLGIVVYSAGLSTIPEEYFDAARVDGANLMRTLWHVTLPALLPTVAFWGIICVAGMLLWLFPFIYSLTAGGPASSSMTPEFYIYEVFGRGDQGGYASALGLTLFVIVATLVAVLYRLTYARQVDQ